MVIHADYFSKGRGGAGGIEKVGRLPDPEPGRVVYVEEDYLAPDPWQSADFNLTLTAGHVRSGGAGGAGQTLSGYSNIDSQVFGNFVDPGGSVSPLPPGLSAIFVNIPAGNMFLKMTEPLLSRVGRVNLTVSYGSNAIELAPVSTDEWRSTGIVPSLARWPVGSTTTIRIFVTGTQRGLNSAGVATIGERTKSPYGPYRESDFDFALSPGDTRGGILGFNRVADGIFAAVGLLTPDLPAIAHFTQDNTRDMVLRFSDAAVDAEFQRLGVVVREGLRTSAQGGHTGRDFIITGGSVGSGIQRWVEGTPVTLRITTPDGQAGLTPEGIRTVGQGNSPRNVVGGERIEADFYHVDPDNGEWVKGLGGAGGGIPAAFLPETGLSDADMRDHKWKGVLVGLAREDAGPDWRMLTAAGQEAVQATTTITSGGASLRISLDSGLAGAAGAEGNAWQADVNPANLSTDPSSARISRANAETPTVFIVIQQSGRTFAQVAALVNAVAGLTATVTGAGGTAFPSTIARQSFTGGLDAAELGVEIDVDGKLITLEHLVGHTQSEIATFLNDREVDDETTLYAILYGGSNPEARIQAAPQERPFGETYPEGSLPTHSADELAALRQRIADNSIAPIKLQAGNAAQQKAMRQRLASSSIGLVANALPAVANHNTGDTLIIGRGGATVVPFREVDAPATELTATVAGDVMMLLAAGWTRIGNLFSGGIAAAAAQQTADRKQDALSTTQLLGLLQFDVVPGTVVGYAVAGQSTDWLTDWRIWVSGGDSVGNVWMSMAIEGLGTLAAPPPATPGASLARHKLSATNIYNYTFSNANRTTLVDGRAIRRQGRDIEIDISFHDAASGGTLIDIVTLSVDWLPSLGGLTQSQVDGRVRAVAGPVIIVSNIASYDAGQNRFEDSSGDEVVVPNNSIVTLTQAVYDAAVADSDFTPNQTAIFLTR